MVGCLAVLACPLVQVRRLFDAILLTLAKIGLMLLRFGVFPAFYCFALGALLANMPLFRVFRAFLEGFMGFVWVCLVLVLFVACVGFCARVELGG